MLPVIGCGLLLTGPAQDWGAKLPAAISRLERRLQFLARPLAALRTTLAVPMLAITKIICDDVEPLKAFGHFLEGRVSV